MLVCVCMNVNVHGIFLRESSPEPDDFALSHRHFVILLYRQFWIASEVSQMIQKMIDFLGQAAHFLCPPYWLEFTFVLWTWRLAQMSFFICVFVILWIVLGGFFHSFRRCWHYSPGCVRLMCFIKNMVLNSALQAIAHIALVDTCFDVLSRWCGNFLGILNSLYFHREIHISIADWNDGAILGREFRSHLERWDQMARWMCTRACKA